jgi:hypothetical protein
MTESLPASLSEITAAPVDTARWVVLAVWALCSLATFWFISEYSSDVPWGDEYDLVPIVTGKQGLSWHWLWSPHNEHRIPLPRLVRYVVLMLTGVDFQVAPYVFGALLSGLGLGTAALVARLRGRFAYTDTFFPLLWLHWGQVENLLWGFQLQLLFSALLATVILAGIVVGRRGLTVKLALLVGLGLLLLPLCGTNGMLTALPLAGWLGYYAIAPGASQGRAGAATAIALAAAGGVFLIAFPYFTGLSTGNPPATVTILDQAKVAVAFLGMAFGPAFGAYWWLAGGLVLLLLIGAAVAAARAVGAPTNGLPRALGLAAFLSTFLVMAAAVGHGRAANGIEGGIQSRYTTLLVPALCAVYYACELYLPAGPGRVIRFGLLAAAAIVQFNADFGLRYAEQFRARRTAFCKDLDAGVPSFLLAEEYHRHPFGLFSPDPRPLDQWLMMLRNARIGRFARMRPSPAYRRMPLDATNSTSQPDRGVVRLAAPQQVYALAIVWGTSAGGPVRLRWRDRMRNAFSSAERNTVRQLPRGMLARAIVPVDDWIDELEIRPGQGSGDLVIREIILLVADDTGES